MLFRARAAVLALFALLLYAAAPLPAQVPADEPVLELRFFDVGQGDAVLLVAPDGRAVLYDGGEDGGRLLRHLERADVQSLELVIASHNHADHIGGLSDVVARYRPRFVVENGVPHTTRTYERFLRAAARAGSQRLEPTRRTLTLDSVRLTILPPPGDPDRGQNDNSVGLRIEYGAFRATLLGDSQAAQQSWWLRRHPGLLGPVHLHKSSHHGSRNGDTPALIASLSPDAVVIGVGHDNRYGHPDPLSLERYREAGAEVHRTDLHGTITVEARLDGTYSLHIEGRARSVASEPETEGGGDCVDLNRADSRTLQAIIHIGPERAGQIVRLRRQRPFTSLAEVTRVRGIGDVRARDITRQGLACVSSSGG